MASNQAKTKSSSGIRDLKTKFDSSSRTNQSIDSKTTITSSSNVSKIQAKGKSVITSSKTKTKTTTTVTKREKKHYSLPGQKFDVPEEREPLRVFYESLSEQIPSSEMAEFWMMEHGMLSPERANKAYEKKQRRQKQIRMGTPIKSPPPLPSRGETSKSRPQESSPPNRVETSKIRPQQLSPPNRVETSKPRPQQFSPPSRVESSKTRPQQFSPPSRGESSNIRPQQFSPPSRSESSNKTLSVSKNGDAKEKKRVIKDSDSDDDDHIVLSRKIRKG